MDFLFPSLTYFVLDVIMDKPNKLLLFSLLRNKPIDQNSQGFCSRCSLVGSLWGGLESRLIRSRCVGTCEAIHSSSLWVINEVWCVFFRTLCIIFRHVWFICNFFTTCLRWDVFFKPFLTFLFVIFIPPVYAEMCF